MKKDIFHDWPQAAQDLSTDKVIALYEAGFAGAKDDPEAYGEFIARQTWHSGEAAAMQFGLAETGKDKLVVPFVLVLAMFPGCWPGVVGQGRGDCVSWSERNASLGTMVGDIAGGLPDETTGLPEQKPDVSEEGIQHGVLSTESFYWWRGYDGDGWSCDAAANVGTGTSGLVVRKDYSEFGVDLTKYSARTAGLYGRRQPGPEIKNAFDDHLIHTATGVESFEAGRDLMFNGYFQSTCGGEGYSSQRDENGVSRRQGGWSHAYARIGYDDRPAIKSLYGEPLVLELNSWAKWNQGPRDIYQSAALVPPHLKAEWTSKGIVNPQTGNIMIPEGSWWSRWSDAKRRRVIALSGVNGWPQKKLPDIDWTP